MSEFRSIMVCVDTESSEHPALDVATTIAVTDKARLTLVDLVKDFSWPTRMAIPDIDRVKQAMVAEKERRLKVLAEPLRVEGLEVDTQVLTGKTSKAISAAAEASGFDLVVVDTSENNQAQQGAFGVAAINLIRRCPCAVWIVQGHFDVRHTHILAAVDASPVDEAHEKLSREIMEHATGLSRLGDSILDVISVWDIYGAKLLKSHMNAEEYARLEEQTQADSESGLSQFLDGYGMNASDKNVLLMRGDPRDKIPEAAEARRIDLIVVGSVTRTGIAGLLISNLAETVHARVDCSVLVLKP